MNRVYQVIWNRARSRYVVVSEIARKAAKSASGVKRILACAAAVGILLSFAPQTAGAETFETITTGTGVASGEASAALGNETEAKGKYSMAGGNKSSAEGEYSFAFGHQAQARGESSAALGYVAKASGDSSLAVNSGTTASGEFSATFGRTTKASGESSFAAGYQSEAIGETAFALGHKVTAKGDFSTALGYNTIASGNMSAALGNETEAGGASSVALGYKSKAMAENSLAANWGTVEEAGQYGMAIGYRANVSAQNSVALGSNARASGKASQAFGLGAQSTGDGATAIGSSAKGWGKDSVALGCNALGKGDSSMALGDTASATGDGSSALGVGAEAEGDLSVAIGNGAMASGFGAMAIGGFTKAEGEQSLAMGRSSKATGYYSQAIGDRAVASGHAAIALGFKTEADGYFAVAAGGQAKASGTGSAALAGGIVEEKGSYAFAAGEHARAKLVGSVALGSGSVADRAMYVTGWLPNDAGDGAAWKSVYNAVSVGTAEKTRQIIGVAAGSEDTDAVNVAQLKAIRRKFAGDDAQGEDKSKVISKKVSETMDIIGGADSTKLTESNIGVNNAEGKLKVQLAKEINLTDAGSVTIGKSKLDNNGLVITGGPSVKADGINMDGKKITNVGDAKNNTDAVNLKQLNEVKDLAGKHTKVTVNGKENSTDGGLTIKKTEVKGQTTYDLALSDKFTIGGAGKDGADGKDGHIGVDGKDGKSGVGIDGKDGITVKGDKGEVGINGNDGISIKGEDGKDGVTIYGKDGVNGVDGAEGHIGLNGKDGMTDIKTTAGKAGLDGADGTTMTRIVYTDPSGKEHEVATLDDGMKYGADNTTADTSKIIKKKLNEQVNVIGGITDASKLTTDDNIGVVSDGAANLKVRLAKDLAGITSLSSGKTTLTLSDSKNEVDMGGAKVTNVANGTADTDAVNKKQMDDAIKKAADGITTAKSGKNITVKDDGTVNLNDNIKIGEGENGISFDGEKGTVNAGKVKVDGGKGTIGGLTNTTFDANNITSGQAATEDQLKQVAGDVSKAAGDASKAIAEASKHNTVKAGTNITVSEGQNAQGGIEYTVATKDSLTVKEIKAGNTTVDGNGVSIKDGPSMTKDGIDGGGKKITNIADGTDAGDAVSKKQLDEAVAANGNNMGRIVSGMNKLNDRMERVGAGAAALAALHPQGYDPESKWDFAAGYGRYRDASALAVGAFYRPNDATMFSIGGSMGGGENLMNIGLSLRVGHRSPYSGISRSGLVSLVKDQKETIEAQRSTIDELRSTVDRQDARIVKAEADNKNLQATVARQQEQIDAILAKLG